MKTTPRRSGHFDMRLDSARKGLGEFTAALVFEPPASAVKAFLKECALPFEDITPRHLRHFLGCRLGSRWIGVVGLELRGNVALLRSLAVRSQYRGRGMGGWLVARAEEYARNLHLNYLYLLTTTAQKFFLRCGYKIIDRATAPASIRATAEFRDLCPASSVCMRKRLSKTEVQSKDERPQ
jgi:amino-acid N-acetyltransferase